MRHPVLLVVSVLAGVLAYEFGLAGLLLSLAAALVCGMLALVLALVLIAAGASRSAARACDRDLHDGEEIGL